MMEKPRGFSRSEAILARNLLRERPTETLIPTSSSTSFAKRARARAGLARCSRCVPERSRKASSMDTGSTRGVSACMRARTARPATRVLLHVRRDNHGVRAGLQGLEHRHRRAHAVGAGDVAGGRDDAALAAADDHRLVGERRVVPLFHRGEEGIAIDMGDGEGVSLRVGEEARRAAGIAAPGGRLRLPQAVAAEGCGGGHQNSPAGDRTARAAMIRSGFRPSEPGDVDEKRFVRGDIIEDARRGSRGRRRLRGCVSGCRPVRSRKRPEALVVGGDEGEGADGEGRRAVLDRWLCAARMLGRFAFRQRVHR